MRRSQYLLSLCLLLITLAGTGCGSGSPDTATPEGTLNAVFEAARSGKWASLDGLCDPLGENDKDTRMICEVSKDQELQEQFQLHFSKGKIDGAAEIEGNLARINFLFGPDGTDKETMKLVNREGKWYLMSF